MHVKYQKGNGCKIGLNKTLPNAQVLELVLLQPSVVCPIIKKQCNMI